MRRYPSSFIAIASTAGPPTNNETTCSPDIFDNSTTVKCRGCVFETEECTIANEVTFVYMSDRLGHTMTEYKLPVIHVTQ